MDKQLSPVLIVDDNPTQIRLLRLFLDACGVPSHAVSTGEEVLDCLQSADCFSIVLMDWRMHPMDGLECAQRVRKQEFVNHKRRTPIVGVTASAMKGDRERCLNAGMDDYLAKPITMRAFKMVLRNWLPGYAELNSEEVEHREEQQKTVPSGTWKVCSTLA